MPQNAYTIAEDADPVFVIIHRHTLSRHRTRQALRDMEREGFVVVRKTDLDALRAQTAPQPGFAAAVLAAAEKRD